MENYIMLSEFQHFAFCRRQWALIHIEQVWEENYLTTSGNINHEYVHSQDKSLKRKDLIKTFGLNVISHDYKIYGKCDCVEFHRDSEGSRIAGHSHLYRPEPVEYKNGKEKEEDFLQVAAQAICLEEMFSTEVNDLSIFYFSTRHRCRRPFSNELREQIVRDSEEMLQFKKQAYIPKVRKTKKCRNCSLKNLCIPEIQKKSAVTYFDSHVSKYLK